LVCRQNTKRVPFDARKSSPDGGTTRVVTRASVTRADLSRCALSTTFLIAAASISARPTFATGRLS
jgi:hypothetical protein